MRFVVVLLILGFVSYNVSANPVYSEKQVSSPEALSVSLGSAEFSDLRRKRSVEFSDDDDVETDEEKESEDSEEEEDDDEQDEESDEEDQESDEEDDNEDDVKAKVDDAPAVGNAAVDDEETALNNQPDSQLAVDGGIAEDILIPIEISEAFQELINKLIGN